MIIKNDYWTSELLQVVNESETHLTPRALESLWLERHGGDRKIIRQEIRQLVDLGELEYTSKYGCTFIERSFNRPVRISSRVVLKPEGAGFNGNGRDVVLTLVNGVSFGNGRHPTTSLCVRGIDGVMSRYPFLQGADGLDIGTGSGILSLVAIKMGLARVEATDYDESARSEARKNADINGLATQIGVSDKALEEIAGPFSLVMANLRFPTLHTVCPEIHRVSFPGALVIVSGFRKEEAPLLYKQFLSHGFEGMEAASERGWCSLVFRKRESLLG